MENSPIPHYYQIKSKIIAGIISGDYRHGEKIHSIPTLSQMYNVSKETVSRAIRELTHEDILNPRKGAGVYVKRIPGREYRKNIWFQKKGAITIVMEDQRYLRQSDEPYVAFVSMRILSGLMEMTQRLDYSAELMFSDDCKCSQAFSDAFSHIDGVVYIENIPVLKDKKLLLPPAEIPFVVVNPKPALLNEMPEFNSIYVNHRRSFYEGVCYLLANGHRQIGFLGERRKIFQNERFLGYQDALKEYDVPFDELLIEDCASSPDEAKLAVDQLFHKFPGNQLTAIVCASDYRALGVLQYAKDTGRKVPDDISVMGFDDIPEAATSDPPLTTVSFPLSDCGTEAARLLNDIINDKSTGILRKELKTMLILRKSCRKL